MFTGWTPKPIIADAPPAISGKFHHLFISVHAADSVAELILTQRHDTENVLTNHAPGFETSRVVNRPEPHAQFDASVSAGTYHLYGVPDGERHRILYQNMFPCLCSRPGIASVEVLSEAICTRRSPTCHLASHARTHRQPRHHDAERMPRHGSCPCRRPRPARRRGRH